MSKQPFLKEYFSINTTDRKSTPFSALHVASDHPLEQCSKDIINMLEKITNLFHIENERWSYSTVCKPIDINELLQDNTINILLCFVDPDMVKKMHLHHPYKGFQEINQTQVIYLPSLQNFAQNQKAKKYLWTSIQHTFK